MSICLIRRRWSTLWSLVLCCAAASPLAQAADEQGNYAVWGIGQASCNQFLKARAEDSARDFGTYLAGYLTAVNTLSPGIHSATGRRTATDNLATIAQYCEDHRMDSFERGIQSLVETEGKALQARKEAPATWGRPTSASSTP